MKSVINEIAYILRDQDIFVDSYTYSYLTDTISISVSYNSSITTIVVSDKEFSNDDSSKLALRIAKVVWLGLETIPNEREGQDREETK